MDLTERQRQLLKAIIELYAKTGLPVGSENIEKETNLGVSPATIRNEMVRLTEMGYIKQPHTSAGRIPTSIGYRTYINELMKERELPVSAEVKMKQDLWQQRFKEQQLLREAVKALAYRCGTLSLAVNDENEVFYAGAANILDFPEFENIDVARVVLSLFDENPMLQDILGRAVGLGPVHVLFGEEMGYEHLVSTGFIFSKFEGKDGKRGIIGVIGPARMNFPIVMPYVKYTSNLIEQALQSW
jgi:heat-inducible transcriptional repressor